MDEKSESKSDFQALPSGPTRLWIRNSDVGLIMGPKGAYIKDMRLGHEHLRHEIHALRPFPSQKQSKNDEKLMVFGCFWHDTRLTRGAGAEITAQRRRDPCAEPAGDASRRQRARSRGAQGT